MADYSAMTDAEFYAECSDAVQHLAAGVSSIARDTARLFRFGKRDEKQEEAARTLLEFTMSPMLELLGNLLNGMDAVDTTDAWTCAIYEELHRRFPRRG